MTSSADAFGAPQPSVDGDGATGGVRARAGRRSGDRARASADVEASASTQAGGDGQRTARLLPRPRQLEQRRLSAQPEDRAGWRRLTAPAHSAALHTVTAAATLLGLPGVAHRHAVLSAHHRALATATATHGQGRRGAEHQQGGSGHEQVSHRHVSSQLSGLGSHAAPCHCGKVNPSHRGRSASGRRIIRTGRTRRRDGVEAELIAGLHLTAAQAVRIAQPWGPRFTRAPPSSPTTRRLSPTSIR